MGDLDGFDRQRATAALFPGQGSQTADMGRMVRWLRPDLAARATKLVGDDPFVRASEGGRFLQPAIFCASIAAWSWACVDEVRCFAGHSLGEIAALVAAGVLSEEDGLDLVVLRGRLCDEAAAGAAPGGMLALMGRGADEAARELAAETGLVVANDNGPRQVVLSGPRAAVAEGDRLAAERKLHAVVLEVPSAMHSPAMETAVAPFAEALARIELHRAPDEVWSCATAAPFTDVHDELPRALTRPVRWRETIQQLAGSGCSHFTDLGPGAVLTGLVKRITPGLQPTALRMAVHV